MCYYGMIRKSLISFENLGKRIHCLQMVGGGCCTLWPKKHEDL